jgi:exodeoxyribonuclease VII large subunit
VRDFLEVIRRRSPNIEVLVIPSRVQGEGAAAEIVGAIETANRLKRPPDVLVVARGGGSLEDLWCFNEESVVRAIFASRVPVVSAVGHEIDVTLSDLVADVRALTPTEAAEIVAPSAEELLNMLTGIRRRLAASLRARSAAARARVEFFARHRAMRRPFERVRQLMRSVDELELRATRQIRRRLSLSADQIAALAGRLDSLNPLAVLRRGYSLTMRAADGKLANDAAALSVGEPIVTRLWKGQLTSRVETIDPAP